MDRFATILKKSTADIADTRTTATQIPICRSQFDFLQEPPPGMAYKEPVVAIVASYMPTNIVTTPIAAALVRATAEPALGTPNALGTLVSGFVDPSSGGRPPVAGAKDLGHTPKSRGPAAAPGSMKLSEVQSTYRCM